MVPLGFIDDVGNDEFSLPCVDDISGTIFNGVSKVHLIGPVNGELIANDSDQKCVSKVERGGPRSGLIHLKEDLSLRDLTAIDIGPGPVGS